MKVFETSYRNSCWRYRNLVKLQRRHRDMVKNGQKLKKGSFSPIKTLTLEMSPIGMIQETRKKNWNKWRRGGNRQKTQFFGRFFQEIMKNPKQKSRLMKKRNHKNESFLIIFWKFGRTGFFIGNGLIDAKKMKAPYRFCYIPHVWKKNVITLTISNLG